MSGIHSQKKPGLTLPDTKRFVIVGCEANGGPQTVHVVSYRHYRQTRRSCMSFRSEIRHNPHNASDCGFTPASSFLLRPRAEHRGECRQTGEDLLDELR